MADKIPPKTFMTPAQQRAYLSDLRKQNEELFGLTGPRIGASRDPWKIPSEGSVHRSKATVTPDTALGEPGLGNGPPKPPKSSQLRTLPTPTKPTFISRGSPESQNVQDSRVGTKERPRSLPKPPQLSHNLPKVDQLTLDNTIAAKKLPPVPQKPTKYVRTASSSSPTTEAAPRKVTLSLTNYDIPQNVPQLVSDQDDLGHSRVRSFKDEASNQRTSRDNKARSIFMSRMSIDCGRESSLPSAHQGVPSFTLSPIDDNPRPSPSFAISEPTDSNSACAVTNFSGSREGLNEREQHVIKKRRRRPQTSEAQRSLIHRGQCCANCYEPLGQGRIITANGKRYHPSHFLCFECGIPLEHVDFYVYPPENEGDGEEEGEVYCHFDYHELFSDRCFVCETPVIRDGIMALGKTYHAEHFFCALCSQTFEQQDGGSTEFVEKDNLAWHPKCYEEKFSTSYMCRKCKQRIKAGEQVMTMGTGSHFHPECFLCAHCKGSLAHGFYWSNAKEGICRPCKELELKQDL